MDEYKGAKDMSDETEKNHQTLINTKLKFYIYSMYKKIEIACSHGMFSARAEIKTDTIVDDLSENEIICNLTRFFENKKYKINALHFKVRLYPKTDPYILIIDLSWDCK